MDKCSGAWSEQATVFPLLSSPPSLLRGGLLILAVTKIEGEVEFL